MVCTIAKQLWTMKEQNIQFGDSFAIAVFIWAFESHYMYMYYYQMTRIHRFNIIELQIESIKFKDESNEFTISINHQLI